MGDLRDFIQRAHRAQQKHDRRTAVQLSFPEPTESPLPPPTHDPDAEWATHYEALQEWRERVTGVIGGSVKVHVPLPDSWTGFWTCSCGVDRLNLPWVDCSTCGEHAPAFDKPE